MGLIIFLFSIGLIIAAVVTGLGVLTAIFAGLTNGDPDSKRFAIGLIVAILFIVTCIISC